MISESKRHFKALVMFRQAEVGNCMVSNRRYWKNKARIDAERKLTEAVLRSSPKLIQLGMSQLEATLLFPGKTGHGFRSYEPEQSSIRGFLDLKTLRIGAVNRNPWLDDEGVAKADPLYKWQ